MAQICINYARPSRPIVRKLRDLLAEHYDVWWDQDLHSGDYRAEIERQLASADCVVPVWCRISRSDADVLDEASFALRHHTPVVPVRIDDVELPLGFGSLHTVDLIGWSGAHTDPRFQNLLKNLTKVLQKEPRLLRRPEELSLGNIRIPTPELIRSVSSHETALQPESAVRALALYGRDPVLVSAYDIIHDEHATEIIRDLEQCRATGRLVLLDSGNYEASRKVDTTWTTERLHEAMDRTPFDAAFCFDDLNTGPDVEAVVRSVVAAVERDAGKTCRPVLPIVHVPRTEDRVARIDLIPELLSRVSRELRPPILAVPERELGAGLLTRVRMVYTIRRTLDELGFYQPVHLLGTGNPLSIAVFAAVGADCFDGLEWCRTVADHETGRLYHFQQYDFFKWQTALTSSAVVQDALNSDKIEFTGKVIFHNLDFFSNWMDDLRVHLRTGKIERFLTAKLPGGPDGMSELENAVPEVFK
jgi:TIR domain